MVSGLHNDNWLARQNSVRLLRAAAARRASRSSSTTARCSTRRRWWSTALWATVGTTNFDNRSFAHNEENNVCCYDREFAQRFHEMFEADVSGCDRVLLDRWTHRGVRQRLEELVAAFLEEQT